MNPSGLFSSQSPFDGIAFAGVAHTFWQLMGQLRHNGVVIEIEGLCAFREKGSQKKNSLPEFMHFKLFGKTVLVVNIGFLGHPLSQ